MTSHHTSPAARIRARLSHPVIDSDGHWLEFEPAALDYLRQVGGERIVERYKGVANQFGNKKLIENALLKKGKQIELVQRHKAESDMAVAAASIVARAEFLRHLKHLEEKHKTELCKGASGKTQELAVKFVGEKGIEALGEIAKLHFKTTDAVKSKAQEKKSPEVTHAVP